MQVESVAWVSATSTVLYTAFYLSAAIVYLQFTEKKSKGNYFLSLVLFLFALLSKSAAVTLPLILLLFDRYLCGTIKKRDLFNKIPFFLLSIAFGIVTIYARQQSGHIVDISKYYNVIDKLFFIIYSFSFYVISNILPLKLSAFHPYPEKTGNALPFIYYVAPLFLMFIVFIIYKIKSYRKELFFGFLFFIMTIIVMIEIIPVGVQIVKERYTYISCLGLYFILSMIIVKLSEKRNLPKIITLTVIVAGIVFSYASYSRVLTWKNSYTLWDDVIKKYPKCSVAYINRGNAYVMDEKYKQAINDYNKAILIEPSAVDAYIDRAIVKSIQKDITGAIEDYNKAIFIGPADDKMYSERALLKLEMQNITGAIEDFSNAIKINPTIEKYYNQRGIAYGMAGKYLESIVDFTKAIELNADYADAYSNRGYAEMNLLQNDKAIKDLTSAIEKNPSEARSYYIRGLAYKQMENSEEACADMKKAYKLGFTAAAEEIGKVCK